MVRPLLVDVAGRPNLPPKARAALWTLGSLASFSAMGVAGRELGGAVSVGQILLVRSVCGVVLMGALLSASGWRGLRVDRFTLSVIAIRNLSHFGATWCWFTGLTLLPLATVFAIEFTMPLWAAILSVLFLGERLGPVRAIGIGIGFAGALATLNPTLGAIDPAYLIVLLAAIGFATAFVAMKRVIGGISIVVFLFYMSVMQLPLGLLVTWGDWVAITLETAPWLAITTVGGLCAHFCLARALRLAQASMVAPMDFLRLPLIAAVGAALYGERLELWVVVGATLICFGNWLNLREEDRRPEPPSS